MDNQDSTSANNDENDSGTMMYAYFLLYAVLMSGVVLACKWLHDRPTWGALFPEAGLIILLGMVAGGILALYEHYVELYHDEHSLLRPESLLNFSSDVFFVGLLPPIIFNSGYHLRRELFVRHFTPICLFAILGTAISAACIAGLLYGVVHVLHWVDTDASFTPTLAELLTFGALISATDPVSTLAVFSAKKVDPQLFYLVFGESVLNDAMGLVLFQEFAKLQVSNDTHTSVYQQAVSFALDLAWLSVWSPLLGIACGVALAKLFQWVDLRHTVLLELSLYVFVLHVPYLLGQFLGLSGIVVILFTGLTARTYVVPNLSDDTAAHADTIFRLLAFLAETAIFLQLGLSVFGLTGSLYIGFVMWALVACLVGRAGNIYPLVAYHNWSIQRNSREQLSDDVQARSTETTSLNGKLSAKTRDRMFYMSVRTPVTRGDLKILPNCAHVLWFAGLRGAVAYACVLTFPGPHRDAFVMTTMMIVLVTVFGLGSTTTAVLDHFEIETNIDEDDYMDSWSTERSMPPLMVRIEEFLQEHVVRKNEHIETVLDAVDEDAEQAETPNGTVEVNFGPRRSSLRSSLRNSFTNDIAGLRRSSVSQSLRWTDQSIYDMGRAEAKS